MPKLAMKYEFLFLLLLVPLSYFDLQTSRYFFQEGHFSTYPFFTFLYDYGEIPAKALGGLSLIMLLVGFVFNWSTPFRSLPLYLLLTLAIGSFLITELTFKNHWGRPRPKNVIEFGGEQKFRPFYAPQKSPLNRSFPCGHCTTGYYFFSLANLCKRLRKKWISNLTFIFAFILGSLIGLARIAQGGHFLTDVFFGGWIMWTTAKGLNTIIIRNLDERTHKTAS